MGATTEKQEKGLVVVQRNLDRLSRSIGALLDFSRMDVGRISLNIQPFGLAQLVEQIATSLRSELEKKHLALKAEIDPALAPVIGDREKISQVLENLVINALKFTPEGGRITVAAARAAGGGRPTAEIRVSDTGIGIPQHHLGRIFNRFHQVDGSTTRRFGGVGLGLAIVKSILDAHGSPISVDSREGRGTDFRFNLPLLGSPPAAHAPDRGREAALRNGKPPDGRVLIVGAGRGVPPGLAGTLEAEGFGVLRAATVEEAREVAARERPDVVILADLPTAEAGAGEQVGRLRQAAGTIPFVVVGSAGQRALARSFGPAEYVDEPQERDRLVARLRELLASRLPGAQTGTGPRV